MTAVRRYLAAAIATLMCLGYALADTTIAPGQRTSVPASGTITLGGTFQTLLAANPSRSGCFIQNTSTHTLFIFLGPTASATLTNTIQVAANGGTFTCASPGGTIVLTDNIAITTSTTADPFVAFWQG